MACKGEVKLTNIAFVENTELSSVLLDVDEIMPSLDFGLVLHIVVVRAYLKSEARVVDGLEYTKANVSVKIVLYILLVDDDHIVFGLVLGDYIVVRLSFSQHDDGARRRSYDCE